MKIFSLKNKRVYVDTNNCLVINETNGGEGDPWSFKMFINELAKACRGRKLSSIASDTKFVGLKKLDADDAVFVIVKIEIINDGKSLIFYVDDINDFLGLPIGKSDWI